jgi:hypothetical protein
MPHSGTVLLSPITEASNITLVQKQIFWQQHINDWSKSQQPQKNTVNNTESL